MVYEEISRNTLHFCLGTPPKIQKRVFWPEKSACGSSDRPNKVWISQKRVFWPEKSACGSCDRPKKALLDARNWFPDTRGRFPDTKTRGLGPQVPESRKKLVFLRLGKGRPRVTPHSDHQHQLRLTDSLLLESGPLLGGLPPWKALCVVA